MSSNDIRQRVQLGRSQLYYKRGCVFSQYYERFPGQPCTGIGLGNMEDSHDCVHPQGKKKRLYRGKILQGY